MVDKEAVSYHPERMFRRRRRERNPAKRRQRRRYYLKNKAKIRQKQRQRRKQLKRNPMYKKRQKQLRRERNRRHMLASTVALAWRVARSWTTRITPNLTRVQLDAQDAEIPMHQFDSMMKSVARVAGGTYDEDTGDIDFQFDPSLQPAYSKLRVLYRFLPDGTVCFDTIPITPRGPSNRLKAYRTFHGEYDEIQDLYKEFLAWLRFIVAGVRKYKHQNMRKHGGLSRLS